MYTAVLPPEKETILISRQTVSALLQEKQELSREALSDDDLIALINAYADEEVLIREAYKQGLDRNNYRVRKQLLDLMRASLSATVAPPGEAQLKAYFEENRDEFRIPELRSFKHAFYKSDTKNIPGGLQDFLKEFETNGSDFNKTGDVFVQGYDFRHLSFEQSALFFGRDFANALFDLPEGSWAGPIRSSEGIHFVLLEKVDQSRIPEFEDIAAYLEESYIYSRNQEIQKERIAGLRENYIIVLEEDEG